MTALFVFTASVFLVLCMVISFAYHVVYDDSLSYEIMMEFKKLISGSDTYDVSSIKISNNNFYVVINEDGLKVPVKCSSDVYTTLKEMFDLNNEDVAIKIKAQINRKDLSVQSIQGYLIK